MSDVFDSMARQISGLSDSKPRDPSLPLYPRITKHAAIVKALGGDYDRSMAELEKIAKDNGWKFRTVVSSYYRLKEKSK